jgi:hypothetical protein
VSDDDYDCDYGGFLDYDDYDDDGDDQYADADNSDGANRFCTASFARYDYDGDDGDAVCYVHDTNDDDDDDLMFLLFFLKRALVPL